MKKVLCIVALGLLVAQIYARPDDKAKEAAKGAVDKAKDAAKGAADKAEDATKAASKAAKGVDKDAEDAEKDAGKIAKKALKHKRKPETDDDEDYEPPVPHHKGHHKSLFSIPIEIGEGIAETGLGLVKSFENYLPF